MLATWRTAVAKGRRKKKPDALEKHPLFSDEALDGLTNQEKLFVINYVAFDTKTFCNATRSAEAAGYDGDPQDAIFRVHASRIVHRPHVQHAICLLLQRRVAPIQEVLARLTDMIRGPAAHVLDIKEVVLDGGGRSYEVNPRLAAAIANGQAHLINGIEVIEKPGGVTVTKVKIPAPLDAIKTYLTVFMKFAALAQAGIDPFGLHEARGDLPDGAGGIQGGEAFWRRLEERIHEEGNN